ncbi:molybdate ABC transporter substrate-binding protein [Heyndrickxia ginsengihumi]|uniref:molybdate ABC transporter substrate-binding protein n=1 Tax=Heyndrickxia ginsengihumi TaxID=363870 RepID=UPI003D24F14A
MKKLYALTLSMMLLLLVMAGCSTKDNNKQSDAKKQSADKKVELTVSAAASLQDALDDIKADFEKDHPNVKLNYNFGASGTLQQQISQGAPVDLFFSAAEDKFDLLVKKGKIDKKKGEDLVGNDLVLIVPKDSNKGITSFKDLTKATKIALGTPEAVPAGQYGEETLKNLNLWKSVKGKVVYGKDVRQVLTYVESGNVDAGIVYKTDALISSKVKIVATASEKSHTPIIYPVGVIKDSSHLKEAQLFYNYLHSKKSMQVFKKYGFNGLK